MEFLGETITAVWLCAAAFFTARVNLHHTRLTSYVCAAALLAAVFMPFAGGESGTGLSVASLAAFLCALTAWGEKDMPALPFLCLLPCACAGLVYGSAVDAALSAAAFFLLTGLFMRENQPARSTGFWAALPLFGIALARLAPSSQALGAAGIIITAAGFGAAFGLFPFQSWLINNSAARLPAAAFIFSVAAPLAACAGAFCTAPFISAVPAMKTLLLWLTALSCVVLPLLAFMEERTPRKIALLLAGQTGWIFGAGLIVPAFTDAAGLILLSYAPAAFGLIAVSSAIAEKHNDAPDALKGLYYNAPLGAAALLFFACTCAGLPMLTGFYGRFEFLKLLMARGHALIAAAFLLALALSCAGFLHLVKPVFAVAGENAETDFFSAPQAAVIAAVFTALAAATVWPAILYSAAGMP